MEQKLWLLQREIGPMANYVYFLGDADSKEAMVVDPAWDVPLIFEMLQKQQYTLKGIIITHGHPDHTNGIEEITDQLDIPVYINKKEAEFFGIHDHTVLTDDNTIIQIGNQKITFLHTPGHTPGSQCMLINNNLITGDTLFLDGCGRCDFPGGDPVAMYHTLNQKIKSMDDNTIIYAGHNYHPKSVDTLGSQKQTNPYLSAKSKEDFLQHRMGIWM